MRQMLKLWNDDCGFAANTVEWLFMVTIMIIGLVTGFVAVRQALLSELIETAQAILANLLARATTTTLRCVLDSSCSIQ